MTAKLAEMTTLEAEQAAGDVTVVVIPVGAFEQHGAGLPLATDQIRAEALADAVAEALPGKVVIGPGVPVGVSPHHQAFAGTVSLRPALFAAVVREYVESLAAHGWRRFLVITGHGGNNATLGTLAQELLRDRPDLELAWTPVTTLAKDAVGRMELSEISGHSGEAETAQMLHIAPHLVRHDLLTPGTTTPDELDPFARLARSVSQPAVALPYDRLSPTGVLGDPRRATAEDGRAILTEATDRIVAFIKEWLDT
ncbi:creatininase family protein [Nocardioides luteus]|uniref:Creatinine amidohydrolase n=1 Tax=Nocardioides luteus TaxID=1844 RepID=A0A1J4N7X7_9ACTN|nr:creatininase family protein [Nocardioides luteus]OIJ27613.1 creatinine amidohydrolase [Nocardioides luteus]